MKIELYTTPSDGDVCTCGCKYWKHKGVASCLGCQVCTKFEYKYSRQREREERMRFLYG